MLLVADTVRTFYFRQPWPLWLLVLFVAAILFLSAFLYRGEPGVALWKRILLGGMRAVIFLIVILLLFEPVGATSKKDALPGNILVLVDVSNSMAFADQRQRPEDLEDAAMALGKMKFTEHGSSGAGEVLAGVSKVSRLDLAKGVLRNEDIMVFHKPGAKYRLGFFSFGDHLEAAPSEPADLRAWLDKLEGKAPATHLGEALQQAVDKYGGQPIAAVIVLTDGASNAGIDPLDVARSLNTPVFPIALGLPKPDDIRLITVTVPDAVFPKDKVPVQVQIEATPGYVGREVELTLKAEGRELDRKRVTLQGTQFEELTFVPEKTTGLLPLEIALSPLAGEAVEDNNRAARTVKIIDEKIRVLYVEGKPRWEFRYLRAVLDRDHRMLVKYLMTEGDPELASERGDPSKYLARLPEDEAATFQHDLVILGEVKADYFSPAQQAWIEKLVRDKGGSFLMLGGRQHAPMSYADTPIAKLLPVRLSAGGRELVDASVHPVLTPAGVQSQIMSLEAGEDDNVGAWSLARPLYDVPRLTGAKPGATVLATLSNQGDRSDPYPLVAWQRYGSGKTMFVASDQFWRLRFKRGDAYHAHFWGQTIQFLTLSRLLGENKRIRLETDRKLYRTSERIIIQASLLDEEYLPLKVPSYAVLVEQVPPRGQPRTVALKPVSGKEGLYQATIVAEHGGDFQVRALPGNEKDSNVPNFQVEAISREDLERDTQHEQLKKLAELTGGKYVLVRELPDQLDKIPDQARTIVRPPQETELWNNWWVFALILTLAGTEWFVRRSNDMA